MRRRGQEGSPLPVWSVVVDGSRTCWGGLKPRGGHKSKSHLADILSLSRPLRFWQKVAILAAFEVIKLEINEQKHIQSAPFEKMNSFVFINLLASSAQLSHNYLVFSYFLASFFHAVVFSITWWLRSLCFLFSSNPSLPARRDPLAFPPCRRPSRRTAATKHPIRQLI